MTAGDRPSAELIELTAGHSDGALTDEQTAGLEQLLLADAGARAYFRRYLALDAALRDHGDNTAEHWLTASMNAQPAAARAASSLRWAKRIGLVAAAVAATAVGIVIAVVLTNSATSQRRVIASLDEVAGDVRLVAASGGSRTAAQSVQVFAGDTLSTSGDASAAVVAYPDGTRLTLVGNTSATCGDELAKSVVIHHGTLAASVVPQPPAAPMVLATPTARVEVLGTRFLIEAATRSTNLSVTEGRVRLVRTRDGEAVEVADGERASVTERQRVVVEEIPRLSNTWDFDFEEGKTAGWSVGEFVTQNLPQGSQGALRAAWHEANDGEVYYAIATDEAWAQGLFDPGPRSHLHITYKMDRPDWLNLFLVTRTSDADHPEFSANFIFKEFPKLAAGQWATISIPLASFRKLHVGAETIDELLPYKLIFNATAPDRGLVIDRVWVTPDGPGEVKVLLDN